MFAMLGQSKIYFLDYTNKAEKMEKNINLTLSKSKTQDEKNRHRVGENIYTAPIHRAHINDKYSAHKELSTLNYMKLILNLI